MQQWKLLERRKNYTLENSQVGGQNKEEGAGSPDRNITQGRSFEGRGDQHGRQRE